MAVVDICESWTGDTGSWQIDDNGNGSATVQRHFTVTVNNVGKIDTSGDVLASNLLPQQGQAHPYSDWFTCRGGTASRLSPVLFEVTYVYQSDTYNMTNHPINQPASIVFGTVTSEEEIEQAIKRNPDFATPKDNPPLRTMAHEPIKGIKKPISDMSFNIDKAVAVFDPTTIFTFANTVNSVAFYGFAAGLVKCVAISARSARDDGAAFTYWNVSYSFVVRKRIHESADERVWWKRIRHEGTKYLESAGDEVATNFEDKDGQRDSQPRLLKDDGTPEFSNDDANVVWFEWQVMETTDFTQLGLGV